jgi:ferredoxin-type protein NapG
VPADQPEPFDPSPPQPARPAGDARTDSTEPSPQKQPAQRRDFFQQAAHEILGPLAGLFQNKIDPFLKALDQLPGPPVTKTILPPYVPPPAPPKVPHEAMDRALRPPGARLELNESKSATEFETRCTRCGDCVRACPADAIRLDPRGLLADGLPYIIPGQSPCVVCDSLACMPACPTGALQLVTRENIHIGTAKFIRTNCLRSHGEDCTLCVDNCPIGPAALKISPITGMVRVGVDACVGCGVCEQICPTDPRAIIVQPPKPNIDPIIA